MADASSGVASYPVTVMFEADPTKIFVGSTVTVDIQVAQRDDVTQVMSRAVTTTDGTSTVTVALEGTTTGPTEERTVTTGETSGGMVEITSGLEPGDSVLVKAPSFGPGGGSPPGGQLPTGAPPAMSGSGGAPTASDSSDGT